MQYYGICCNITQLTQYYAILCKFTHMNLRKTYIFESLCKFMQCKLTQTYANLHNIMVPIIILRNIMHIMQTYVILRYRNLRNITSY